MGSGKFPIAMPLTVKQLSFSKLGDDPWFFGSQDRGREDVGGGSGGGGVEGGGLEPAGGSSWEGVRLLVMAAKEEFGKLTI